MGFIPIHRCPSGGLIIPDTGSFHCGFWSTDVLPNALPVVSASTETKLHGVAITVAFLITYMQVFKNMYIAEL